MLGWGSLFNLNNLKIHSPLLISFYQHSTPPKIRVERLEDSPLSNIFDRYIEGSTIFKNRECLRHDYVPDFLPHREDQIARLGMILAPTLKGNRCSNIFIYGKPGTGKTAVARYVLKHLSKKSVEVDNPLKICYINCRTDGSDYRILTHLCESIGVNVPFTGLSSSEVFKRFKNGLKMIGTILIIVLDEVDILIKNYGDELLYKLTRINEESEYGKLVIIGISNDLQFKDYLDPRVLSCLSEEELVFRPYTADELFDILQDRVKLALKPNTCTEAALRLCAALAASEHGDARRALDLLRVSAEIAEREGANNVLEEHVRAAQSKIEEDRVLEVLKTLPLHSKLLLSSIFLLKKRESVNRIMTGVIYDIYAELCSEIGLEPLTQRRVSGLLAELDALGIINAKVVSLGRHGRSKQIKLNVPLKTLKAFLSGDPRLNFILEYSPKSPAT